MRGRVMALIMLLVLAVCLAGTVTQADGGPPVQIVEDRSRPLGLRVGGWIEPQYALGTVEVDEYTYPGSEFPLDLVSGETTVTSNFGYRYLDGVYDEHFGLDLAANGDSVYAAAGGTVTVADTNPGGAEGRWVEIKHGSWYTRYMHLQSLDVSLNETVYAGDQIGVSGGSGFGSDTYYDPHLHFEIRHARGSVKVPYDPLAFYTTLSTYRWDAYSGHSGCPYIPTTKRGNSGIWVYLVQDSLVYYYGYSLTVDGSFGALTEAAVKQFQTDCGLTADGIVGAQTWAQLMGNIE